MRPFTPALPAAMMIAFAAAAGQKATPASGPPPRAPLLQVQTIALPGVAGRIDHFGADLKGQRLFVAALGNNTVEVLDLRAGKRINSISGLLEPQGIAYLPDVEQFLAANAKDGALRVFDGKSFAPVDIIRFSSDADNVRYDAAAKRAYLGYGRGAIAVLEGQPLKRVAEIRVDGHPESFQFEKTGSRIFVNVPTAGHVAVLDRTKNAVLARWPIKAGENFPMALDEQNHRLFVGCRRPPVVLVLDTETGAEIARMPSAGDADDLFYDARRKRIYVSGGEGFISVFEQKDAGNYAELAKLRTAPRARTSLFIPELDRLCLGVPAGDQPAEIRVYQPQ